MGNLSLKQTYNSKKGYVANKGGAKKTTQNNKKHQINPGCKYISFFDLENDVWNANKLQIQYNLMASSDYDVIGCETTHSTQSVSAVVPRTIKKSESSLFTSCPFLFSTVLTISK